MEISDAAGDLARQWCDIVSHRLVYVSDANSRLCRRSYLEGVRRGYLTKDPSQLNDPHVCDAYVQK